VWRLLAGFGARRCLGSVAAAAEWEPRVSIMTASSETGKACAFELLARSHPSPLIRGCFRSEIKAIQVTAAVRGMDAVVGMDAFRPSSLTSCLEGVDVAVVVTPFDATRGFERDSELSENMIHAAVTAGVRRIIYVGSWTVKEPQRLHGIAQRFYSTENYLKHELPDDVEWTVLRGGYFMNNFLHLFKDSIRADGVIRFPKIMVPAVDTRDIGRCAAALALEPTDVHHGKVYHMSGPVVLSMQDIADVLSRALRTKVRFEELSVDAWCADKIPALVELVQYLVKEQALAVPFHPEHISQILGGGEDPTSLEVWAKEHRAVF